MTNGIILVLFAGCFVAANFVNANFLDADVEEERQRVNFDPLDLLRQYVLTNSENRRHVDDEFENWTGRWMPNRPGDPTPPPKVFPKTEDLDYSSQVLHQVPMGQPSNCDDARTNLTVDWNGSPVNHTCYDKRITPNRETVPIKYCEHIPPNYVSLHKCMHERIQYDTDLPLFGPHRPLWPVYGEYKFLPKERWLHSLEHGAIVMLYHPCANPLEIKRLRSLVTGCLRRYVVSPYNLLDEDRPLALLAWGCRLTMSYVNPTIVTKFIREHALRGPEQRADDGNFTDGLLSVAKTVSDAFDTKLCPNIDP